ncbi:hypothetical protein [Hypericibacter sp.]|uniref:hypothetical protein n=1 Tax=Hypericibacter sp. TaxID=2705401 RepID=UPI003D6D3BFC
MTAPTMELAPEAVLSPQHGHCGVVARWMHFPDSPALRSQLAQTETVEDWLYRLEAGERLSPEEIANLVRIALHTPPPADMAPKIERQQRLGYGAGLVVFNALLAAQRREAGSKGRTLRGIDLAISGKKASASNNVNEIVWKTFRPVAHLWAAWIILFDKGEWEARPMPCIPADLPNFLSLAEGVRTRAETTTAPRSGTVLTPGEAVMLPDEVRRLLPGGQLEIETNSSE